MKTLRVLISTPADVVSVLARRVLISLRPRFTKKFTCPPCLTARFN